jgi:hypothetical protein
MSWTKNKFRKFLTDNTPDRLWEDDDLFKGLSVIMPDKDKFDKVLGDIYQARGKLSHSGQTFPTSSTIGASSTIPARVFMSVDFSSKPFPPVVWFERVVNYAINTFIERSFPVENVM